ncbi:MAG: manganese efflux pump MntP family protein [Rikenellaceae bacterium]
MSIFEIFILSVGLCFDTFAVSLSSGICLPYIGKREFIRIVSFFAIFQSGFTLLGWLAGSSILQYIKAVDHWIAFALLVYIGGKMVYESLFKKSDEICVDLRVTRTLVTVAIATSIDALAVGVSLALINLSLTKIFIAWFFIAATTALSATTGIKGGRKIGAKAGKRSELLGGLILIAIGVKILIEHLEILS